MAKLINIVGEKFGRLTVVSYSHKAKNRHSLWKCVCECGKEITALATSLKMGNTLSCGCLHKERASQANKTHGKSRTPIHRVWKNMVQRCTNPNNTHWDNYGGRGITVCEEWLNSFAKFYEDVGDLPSPKHSIDRINNNLGYFHGNIRWATNHTQIRNRRNSIKVEYLGQTESIFDICKKHGINYFLAYNRIVRNKQPVADAIAELICSKKSSIAQGLEEKTNPR